MAEKTYREAMSETYGHAYVDSEIARAREYHSHSMSVGELIEELSKLDPSIKVYREDAEYDQQSVREVRPGKAECMGESLGQIVVID